MVSVHVCMCFNVVADVVAYVTLSFFVAVREIRLYFFFFFVLYLSVLGVSIIFTS